MKSLVWQHLPCNDAEAAALAAALDVHPTVARLLCLRGLADPDTARRLGAAARERAELFTWQAVGERMLRALGLAGGRQLATFL